MKLLYFAWIRERTGVVEEDVTPPPEVTDIGTLIAWLKSRGGGFAEAFADPAMVRCAVNHEYVRLDHPLGADDEIALFPPVTGG